MGLAGVINAWFGRPVGIQTPECGFAIRWVWPLPWAVRVCWCFAAAESTDLGDGSRPAALVMPAAVCGLLLVPAPNALSPTLRSVAAG